MSGYVPLSHQPPLLSEANTATPVLMCHGDCDPVVDYSFGQRSYEELKKVCVGALGWGLGWVGRGRPMPSNPTGPR